MARWWLQDNGRSGCCHRLLRKQRSCKALRWCSLIPIDPTWFLRLLWMCSLGAIIQGEAQIHCDLWSIPIGFRLYSYQIVSAVLSHGVACSPVTECYQIVKSRDEMRSPSRMTMIIGICKNNCTRSDECKGKQLHLDTSTPWPDRTSSQNENQELDQLDEESENKEKDDTSIYIGPTPLVRNLRLIIKKYPQFHPRSSSGCPIHTSWTRRRGGLH